MRSSGVLDVVALEEKKTRALERNQRKQEHLREERHAAACGLIIFP
jgi:hypothetical protein